MKRTKRRTKRIVVYIAAVVTPIETMVDIYDSARNDGSWASFIGIDKDRVIELALRKRDEWIVKGYGPYDVYVGNLNSKAVSLRKYKLAAV